MIKKQINNTTKHNEMKNVQVQQQKNVNQKRKTAEHRL